MRVLPCTSHRLTQRIPSNGKDEEDFKGYLLLSSLTAMPFTTSNYRERARRKRGRKRGRESGMLFPPIHQSSIYIWWKTMHTGRFPLLCLVPDIRWYDFEKQNGNKRKTCETSTQQRRWRIWWNLNDIEILFLPHVSHLRIINETWQSVQKISKAFLKQTNQFCFGGNMSHKN